MLIDYKKFEIIKYKDYEINHNFNIKILETLEQFVVIANKINLNYYLTGSISLSLLSNKIYRTWKDIDIMVEKDSIYQFTRILPRHKWYYKDSNKNSTRIFYSKYDTYIELCRINNKDILYNKKHLKIRECNGILIGNPKPMFFWKKNLRKNISDKDLDDETFFKQYIDLDK